MYYKLTPLEKAQKTLLIVHQSPLFALAFIKLVKEKKIALNVHTAFNYQEATQVIVQEQPGVVLISITSEDKTGARLLEFTRDKYPGINCIVIMNKMTSYHKNKMKKLGVEHLYPATVDSNVLLKIIDMMS